MEKRVLGRGLSALIPDSKSSQDRTQILDPNKSHGITIIPIDKIKAGKYQPRMEFDKQALEDLAASIKEKGLIQPVVVRTNKDEYEVIAGERRLKAAAMLNLKEIPAIIKDASDLDALELSIIENVQREDLNPIDQAKAYKRLVEEFSMTQDSVADTIGKDRATIANIIRLLKLPEKIKEYVSRGTLSMGHARAILSLDTEQEQMRLCTKVVKNGLSVRETERYAKNISTKQPKKSVSEKDPNLVSIEQTLRDKLGTKVTIHKGKKGGKIEIEFYSDADLEKLITCLKTMS